MKQKLKSIARSVLILAATAAAAYALYWFLGLDLSSLGNKEKNAFVFEDMHMRVWKDDKVRWELWADRVEISGENEYYVIRNIYRGVLYRDDKIYRFTAKRATYDSEKKQVHIYGRINFESDSGDFFRSRDAFWDGNREILSMPHRVVVMEDKNLFTGEAFEASGEQLENFTVKGNVTVIIPDVEQSRDEDVKKDLEEAEIEPGEVKNLVLKAQRVEYAGKAKVTRAFPTRNWAPDAPPPSQLIPAMDAVGNLPSPALPPGGPGALPPPIANPGAPGALPPGLAPGPIPGLAPMPGQFPVPELPARHVTLTTDAYQVKSQELFVRSDDKLARAVGGVHLVRKGRKPGKDDRKFVQAIKKRDTLFITDELRFFWGQGRVEIDTPLTVQQKELTISSSSALILTKQDRAELRGGVYLHQENGEWLFKEKVVEDDAEKKTKDIARAETTLTASAMDLDFDNEDILATGNVTITQPERSLAAGTAVYTGATKIWEIYGDVTVHDKQDFYKAPLFTYNEDTGEITAPDGAYVEILPDEDQRADYTEYFKNRDKDDFNEDEFKTKKILVRGDHMRFDDEKKILVITGNADVRFKDANLTADTITVYTDLDMANADGHAVAKDKYSTLTAKWVAANWDTEDYEAGGGVHLTHAGNPKKKNSDPFELKGDKLVWNKKTGAGSLSGNPVITSRGRRATADAITFNSEDNTSDLSGNVTLHQDNGDWLRDKDYIDKDDEQAWALAKKPTDATSDTARFESDRDYFLLQGQVHVTQKEKDITTDRLEFMGKEKRLLLDGNVHMAQSDGEWLFEGGFIEDNDDEDVKKRARKPADVYAERLESQYGERKLLLSGGVRIVQGKSSAQGDTLWHYGKDKLTVLEGSVRFVDEDGRELKAKRMVYNGKTKELEAFNSITGAGFSDSDKKKSR